ncbi:MAG: hypothetical protein KatS3mg060_2140 [Dehalococcoidia bacterium]|nr:MAG: hypothetical protein KatS3mg060_2140 [Dehalococcoidia bacterium]
MSERISRRGAVKAAAFGAAGAALATATSPAAAQGFGPEGAWVIRWEAVDRWRVLPMALLPGGIALVFDTPLAAAWPGLPAPRYESAGVGQWGIRPDGAIAVTVFSNISDQDGVPTGSETWSATFVYDPVTDTLSGRHRWTEHALNGDVLATATSTNLHATRVRIEPVP